MTNLHFDALAEAEKITGKSYKEDHATMLLGMSLAMQNNEAVATELAAADDFHYNVTFVHAREILTELGFLLAYEETFNGNTSGTVTATGEPWYNNDHPSESYVVYYRPDGILATLESYGETINNAKIYYNWKPYEHDSDSRKFVSSGGWVKDRGGYGDWVLEGYHDVRKGLRQILSNFDTNGDFVNPWLKAPHLWLLNYAEAGSLSKDFRESGAQREAINLRKMEQFPIELQCIMTGTDPLPSGSVEA